MAKMNYVKYKTYDQVAIPKRSWPGRRIEKAPIWCSVDLRDGNQALNVPMNLEQKCRLFALLTEVGFKEIEVGFPSAAQVEFDFMRKLADDNLIPDDVGVQVLTQSREHLIRSTFDSLQGVKNAIVHLYNSTSVLQREVVFRMSRKEIVNLAVDGAVLIKRLIEENKNPGIRVEYSPESFTGTEIDFAVEVCEAVMDVFEPTPQRKLIINLPATVEMSTPNIYADLIEYFCTHVKNRDSIIVSLHTHNDRGTSVAASELGLLAGADRVEGTLFGNGERTGNLDIVNMALNLFSQGIDPMLDFSDINYIRDVYIQCTGMPIHPRHPYVGDLVYTAFSGSHQDAINKGMKAVKASSSRYWEVPYLPIDPKDVGRTYESIIRINSQSGKGGVAYIMEQEFGFKLPKAMHPEFGKIIQKVSDREGTEISSTIIMEHFRREYIDHEGPYAIRHVHIHMDEDMSESTEVKGTLLGPVGEVPFSASGNGPIDAFVKGINAVIEPDISLLSYDEHAVEMGSDSKAVAYIGIRRDGGKTCFGVGIDANISMASFRALICALNRSESACR